MYIYYVYICIYKYVHYSVAAVEYYTAMRKMFILLFLTKWIDLEGIMLCGMGQIKINTIHHLYVESKIAKLKQTEMVVFRDWGWLLYYHTQVSERWKK